MLVDILQKINKSLPLENFASILYQLINSSCGRISRRIEISPYDQLKPTLDEQYTLKFISSLKKELYFPKEIAGVLIHLYQYSYTSNIESLASVTLQPYVVMNVDKNHNFILNYKRSFIYDYPRNMSIINNFSNISEPIEFLEERCYINIPDDKFYEQEMEIIYSHENCDQYLAFYNMLKEASRSSNGSLSSDNKPMENASYKRQAKISDGNKKSREIFSPQYWCGFYYYGINSTQYPGNYVFDRVLKDI